MRYFDRVIATSVMEFFSWSLSVASSRRANSSYLCLCTEATLVQTEDPSDRRLAESFRPPGNDIQRVQPLHRPTDWPTDHQRRSQHDLIRLRQSAANVTHCSVTCKVDLLLLWRAAKVSPKVVETVFSATAWNSNTKVRTLISCLYLHK